MGGMGKHYLLLPEETMIEYLKVRSMPIRSLWPAGDHDVVLKKQKHTFPRQIFYVANASYPSSAGLIKLALLFQYLRVYEKGTPLRIAVVITTVIVALWCLAYSILSWIPTVPVSAYWNLTMPAVRYAYGSLYVEPFVLTYTSMTASNMVLDSKSLSMDVLIGFMLCDAYQNSFKKQRRTSCVARHRCVCERIHANDTLVIILGLAGPILLYNKTSDWRSRWSLLCLFSIGSV